MFFYVNDNMRELREREKERERAKDTRWMKKINFLSED